MLNCVEKQKANLVHTEGGAFIESTGRGAADGSLEPNCGRSAGSSVGEHHVHTVGVGGSIPSPRTPDPIAAMLANDARRLNVEERFWPKVMVPLGWDQCWIWRGARKRKSDKQAYGGFKIRSYVSVRAHRLSYALYNNHSPGGLLVCHHCDNPQCVNPTHLFLGTVQDNSDDMVRKGRSAKRDQRGELNGAAKLSSADVERVQDLIRAGLNNKAIAARYGVPHQAISKIRRGKAWGIPPLCAPYSRKAVAESAP